jgi:hypothetical protein
MTDFGGSHESRANDLTGMGHNVLTTAFKFLVVILTFVVINLAFMIGFIKDGRER